MKLTILDIVALAKTGYSKKDIDALINSDISDGIEETEPTENIGGEEKPRESEVEKPTHDDKDADNNDDYKKLYETTLTELNNIKLQVKNLQENNVRQNVGGNNENTDIDTINDAVRKFM